MKAATALFALALLTGCAHEVASSRGIDGPVKLGQVANVGGPRIRPDRLIEDSRCPINTQCVWAGRVVLRVTIFGGNRPRQIDLVLGEPVPLADGILTLVSVEPQPTSGSQAQPQQLRFTFAFQGGL